MSRSYGKMTLITALVTAVSLTTHSRPTIELGFKGGVSISTQSTENTGFVSLVREATTGMDFTDDFAASARTGFQAGGFAAFSWGEYFSIQPELVFSQKGVIVSGTAIYEDNTVVTTFAVSENITLSYLEIPILAKFRIPTPGKASPSIYFGPAFAFNFSGSDDAFLALSGRLKSGDVLIEYEYTGTMSITNIRKSNAGLMFGCDLKFPAGSMNLIADIRYTIGMSKVFEDVDPDDIPVSSGNDLPDHFPIVDYSTGVASDAKNRNLSIMLGLSFNL